MHIVTMALDLPRKYSALGVVEVKSYACGISRLRSQLAKHAARINQCVVHGKGCSQGATLTKGKSGAFIKVAVVPDRWKLSREFSFIQKGGKNFLDTPAVNPPEKHAKIEETGPHEWRIVLRWSQEALADAAYEMTFWYMAKLGETICLKSHPSQLKMTPADAGRNAAKEMLYYAIHRNLDYRTEQRAIALYNSYGFGYSLGMNFRDTDDRREMLWPEDLEEIAKSGKTKYGSTILQVNL